MQDEGEIAELFMDDPDDKIQMHDSLLLAGVKAPATKLYAATVTGSIKPETLFEVYGRGSIVQEAAASRRNLNIEGSVPWTCEQAVQMEPPGTSFRSLTAMRLGDSRGNSSQTGALVFRLVRLGLSGM